MDIQPGAGSSARPQAQESESDCAVATAVKEKGESSGEK